MSDTPHNPWQTWRFVKALPSIHRKEFTWHQGRAPTADDIFRAHASSDGASPGHAWFDSLVRTEIKHAQERRSPAQPPMTPYEIGFGEATRIVFERFERDALAHDNEMRSEEYRRRILASACAPVDEGW